MDGNAVLCWRTNYDPLFQTKKEPPASSLQGGRQRCLERAGAAEPAASCGLSHLHLSAADWGGSSGQSSEIWRSMEIIPVGSMCSITACCGEKVIPSEDEIMAQTKKKKGTQQRGKKVLADLLLLGSSAHHYFKLPICSSPCSVVEGPHKDPFCPRCHRSHVFSALVAHELLHRENTK